MVLSVIKYGQTFCDLHTRLHPFYLISHVIKTAICNFLLSYCVLYAYFELYPFLHKYAILGPSEMHGFSLHDLHTIYLPPLGEYLVHKFIPPKLDDIKILLKYT